ncbi:hypothetical protein BRADI_1g76981v3 [Brachypodium distachyon]|uniref:Uncharacterized protein n=1 Tax=Brachypodium distachyon TaxID=15368 RepID=A0A0Q3KI47_BRADI|nr:hypothetical protein BRADI_1g76981v3 [Brachypodium distachyon]
MASSEPNTRPPCAGQGWRPHRYKNLALKDGMVKGMVPSTCWCGDPCNAKESMSPPPLCRYYTWIDLEQSEDVLAIMKIERNIIRARWQEMMRRDVGEEAWKVKAKEERKKKEEQERIKKEARQAERERKRERARIAQEEEEERNRKGKWPRVTQ